MSIVEEGIGQNPDQNNPGERHLIQLGIGFKPFENAQDFYEAPNEGDGLLVPESYAHYIYLRRLVSLYGMDGCIDVIGEKPVNILSKWGVQAANYGYYSDHPFGDVPNGATFQNREFQLNETETILRFSFLAKKPTEYIKLVSTYGIVDLGKDKFLLVFCLNQKTIKRRLETLENGQPELVPEKNLFNLKTIEELERISRIEGREIETRPQQNQEPPERITFVTLPAVLAPLQTINITFHRFDSWGEPEYPTQPIQPNRKPIPVFV